MPSSIDAESSYLSEVLMPKKWIRVTSGYILVSSAVLLTAGTAQQPNPNTSATDSTNVSRKPTAHDEPSRAFHTKPPEGPLPATLDPAQFQDNKAAFVVYSIAAKIPKLLYQEPCYCFCDRNLGHESLLDCFTSRHGVGCHLCQRGIIFSYEQSKLGKTPAEIRSAMKQGLEAFDRETYVRSHYEEYNRPK
jgi:hypothetical protein